uniref:PH domain-containing protein n=1 Tax=Panagrolaimus superbus TaxID=310955 RepID=A0A914ZAT4_9BILA
MNYLTTIRTATQLDNDGYLFYYKFGLFQNKWNQIFYKLHSHCIFDWFYDEKFKKPSGSVNLKNVAPYICIGPQTRLIPFKKPKLEKGWNQNQLIGIVKDRTVHYFYFKSIDNLKQWLSKVINKFPSDAKDTYTSSPYFSKNGQEIRVDHNITTIYNSLDNFLGLYGFGWHFWLKNNKDAPVYGNFNVSF